ncbi:glyoxalase superfamily protein [Actinosynnema sp. NPDC020468]|uniref:VOC family protein n=1 Tax=Actinosynnema sp. NPDC020468 TaxID=3154488 RepID=UPI003409CED1
MDWKLEAVIIPVSDPDRSKAFYADKLGFPVDVDHQASETFRVIQVTPPGSACSIVFGRGIGDGQPGTVKNCHLVVPNIEEAERHLTQAGITHGGIQHFHEGAMTPGPHPDKSDYSSYIFFEDPDGNSWAVQHVNPRPS